MLRYVLVFAFVGLCSPVHAFSKCKLSLHECAVVLEELEDMLRAEIRDDLLLAPLPVAVKQDRVLARMHGRNKQLFSRQPSYIAAEVVRMRTCMIKDDTAAMQGKMLNDPKCG